MDNIDNQNINELLTGGEKFRTILKVLRDSLSIYLSNINIEDKYGAIAFFKYDTESCNVKMNFFPLFEEVIDVNFPENDSIRIKYLKEIIKERDILDVHYYNHFKNNYHCSKLGELEIDDEDLLEHSKELIKNLTWDEYIESKDIKTNNLDLLFFKRKQKNFTLIPLPILSSPCILLFLPITNKINSELLLDKISDSINNYVFNRLMIELKRDLRPQSIPDRQAFIKRFIDEFNQVALPIKYKYQSKEEEFFNWYGCVNYEFNEEHISELKLNLDGEEVIFFLPSYWIEKNFHHKIGVNIIKSKHIAETIQNIFDLVYSNWLSINSERAYLENEVKQVLRDTRESIEDITKLNKNINNLEEVLMRIASDKGVENDNEFYYRDEVVGDKIQRLWKLRFNGFTYFEGKKELGFALLHKLISHYQSGIEEPLTNKEMKQVLRDFKTRELKSNINSTKISDNNFSNISEEINAEFDEFSYNEITEDEFEIYTHEENYNSQELRKTYDEVKVEILSLQNEMLDVTNIGFKDLIDIAKLMASKHSIENTLKIKHNVEDTKKMEKIIQELRKSGIPDVKKIIAEIEELRETKKIKKIRTDGWTTNVRTLLKKCGLSEHREINKFPHTIFKHTNFKLNSEDGRYIPDNEARNYKFILKEPVREE